MSDSPRDLEVSDYDALLEDLQHPSFYGPFCTQKYRECWRREFDLRGRLYEIEKPNDPEYKKLIVEYHDAVIELVQAYREFEFHFWEEWSIDARRQGELDERLGHVNPPRPRSE